MTLHSIYSASAAGRWYYCVGSIAMCRGLPKRGSGPAAREGTACHTLGERCLRSGDDAYDHIGDEIEVEGQTFEVDDEMADAVQLYVDYVRGISGMKWYEVLTYYGSLVGVPDDEAFGTSDTVVLDGTVLHIIDAKFGRRYVSPEKNKQLMLYAAGVVEAVEAVGEEVTEVVLHIVQPRVTARPVPFHMTREELAAVVADFRERVQRAEEAGLLFQPAWATEGFASQQALAWVENYLQEGETQCQWCEAAAVCPKLRTAVDEFAAGSIEDFDVVNVLEATDGSYIQEALEKIPLVETWIKAVEHEGFRRLTNGKKVPGYKLITGREGNRKWIDEDQVREVFEDLGNDLENRKLKSPAQIEKVLKKDPRKAKIAGMTQRSPARPTMVRSDDPRKEWVEAASHDEFGVVAEPDGFDLA